MYLIITAITTNFLQIESKIFDYLSKDYPNKVVQNYMRAKKWWWVSYAVLRLIGIKVLLVVFCLNFIKLFDIESLEKVKFSDFLNHKIHLFYGH